MRCSALVMFLAIGWQRRHVGEEQVAHRPHVEADAGRLHRLGCREIHRTHCNYRRYTLSRVLQCACGPMWAAHECDSAMVRQYTYYCSQRRHGRFTLCGVGGMRCDAFVNAVK